MKQAKDFKI